LVITTYPIRGVERPRRGVEQTNQKTFSSFFCSFDVTGGYLFVELTLGICTQGRTKSSRLSGHFTSDPGCPRLVQYDVVIVTSQT